MLGALGRGFCRTWWEFSILKDCILDLELSLAKSASSEADLRFHISALRADLAAARVELETSNSCDATPFFEFEKLCADSLRITSQALALISLAEDS